MQKPHRGGCRPQPRFMVRCHINPNIIFSAKRLQPDSVPSSHRRKIKPTMLARVLSLLDLVPLRRHIHQKTRGEMLTLPFAVSKSEFCCARVPLLRACEARHYLLPALAEGFECCDVIYLGHWVPKDDFAPAKSVPAFPDVVFC